MTTTTNMNAARTEFDQNTIDLAIEDHVAFDQQVQIDAAEPIGGYECGLLGDLDLATDEQEIAAIETEMAGIYDTIIPLQWIKAEEAAGAKDLRVPMDHDLRSAFAAYAHLPIAQHAEQVRRILAGMLASTSEILEQHKLEELIVNAVDWLPVARDGDRFDAPKTPALKKAMTDWGVIETSREMVQHRMEQEEIEEVDDLTVF